MNISIPFAANLIQAYLIGLIAVDLVHDLPAEYNAKNLSRAKEYYCNLYDGLFQVSGLIRVFLPVCLAAFLILRRRFVEFRESSASKTIYTWVIAVLSVPGFLLFGVSVYSVAIACSDDDHQQWKKTLIRLAIYHICMVFVLIFGIMGLTKAEDLSAAGFEKKSVK